MYFDSVSEFVAMGGHGFFVWSAYAISALLIIGNIVLAARQQRQVRGEIQRRLRRERGPAQSAMENAEKNTVEGKVKGEVK